MVGERAALEGGRRTLTLTAVMRCKVAMVSAACLDLDALRRLAIGHGREEVWSPDVLVVGLTGGVAGEHPTVRVDVASEGMVIER